MEIWLTPDPDNGIDEDILAADIHIDYDDAFLGEPSFVPNVFPFGFPPNPQLNVPKSNVAGGDIDIECGFLGVSVTEAFYIGTLTFAEANIVGTGKTDLIFAVGDNGNEPVVKDLDNAVHTVTTQNGSVTVSVEQTLVVNVAPQDAADAGCSVGESSVDGLPYMTGEEVDLDAQECPCWSFVEWTGVPLDGSTAPTPTITMDDDYTVTAVYTAAQYTLDINIVGNGTTDPAAGTHVYNCGADASITPTPADDWVFEAWSGDLTGDTVPGVISDIQSNKVVTATFLELFDLVFTTDPEGGTVGAVDAEGDGDYEDGESVTVTADPAYCYEFVGWTGDLAAETEPVVTFDVVGDMAFEAVFAMPSYTLDTVVAPAEADAAIAITPPGGVYSCGTTITATASYTDPWGFDAWSGALTSSDETDSFVIEADSVLTGNFVSTYKVTVGDAENGTTLLDPPQPVDGYDPDTVVVVTADPDDCYEFAGWLGDLASETEPVVTITITSDLAFTPTFSLITYDSLTANIDPVGAGTVALDPASGPYDCGTTITATATPMSGTLWVFENWSGAATGESNPVSFVLDETSGTTLTAHFMMYKLYLPLVVRNA
jgi:hypothetical protein